MGFGPQVLQDLHRLGYCNRCMAKVAGSIRYGTGVEQGFPIGRLEHQSKGQTSSAASVEEAVKTNIMNRVI